MMRLLVISQLITVSLAFDRFQAVPCTNGSTVFATYAKFVTECAVLCGSLPACGAFVFANSTCTGLDGSTLLAPNAGAVAPVYYVNWLWLPLPAQATKVLLLINNQTGWMPLPSRMGVASTCSQPPAYPVSADHPVGAVVNGRAVFCGGLHIPQCFQLNPTTNTWDSFPSLNTNLFEAASVMTPYGWWLVGGQATVGYATKTSVFDNVAKAWASGSKVPTKIALFCVAKITPTTYLVVSQSLISMYDWTTGLWSTKQNMTNQRYYVGCTPYTYLNGSKAVLAVGGNNGASNGAPLAVESFSLATETWTTLPNLTLSASMGGALVYDGSILVLVNTLKNQVLRFDDNTLTFSLVTGLSTGVALGPATAIAISDDQLHGCT